MDGSDYFLTLLMFNNNNNYCYKLFNELVTMLWMMYGNAKVMLLKVGAKNSAIKNFAKLLDVECKNI